MTSDRGLLVTFALISVAITYAYWRVPTVVPLAAQLLPLYLAGVYLNPRTLPWFIVFLLGNVALMTASDETFTAISVVRLLVVFIVAGLTMHTALGRARLGITGRLGESMLLDLQDRIQRQGQLPEAPPGWFIDAELRSAGDTSFAGDFALGRCSPDNSEFDIVVVDVSGKGVQAGTRSLMLTGAFGALLSAVPHEEFLTKANDFLLGLDWGEGFATAIHLHVWTDSGDFELRSAGHPPAVHLSAGSGLWRAQMTEGPVLGLMPGAEFSVVRGRLRAGDAIMLYTDGLVEERTRDITMGIDRLVGEAEKLVREGFHGAARRIVEHVDSPYDDRALVLVHRD